MEICGEWGATTSRRSAFPPPWRPTGLPTPEAMRRGKETRLVVNTLTWCCNAENGSLQGREKYANSELMCRFRTMPGRYSGHSSGPAKYFVTTHSICYGSDVHPFP